VQEVYKRRILCYIDAVAFDGGRLSEVLVRSRKKVLWTDGASCAIFRLRRR